MLWGTRVIVPEKYREQLLNELHEGHQGVVRTKAWARSFMWWPKLDANIEALVKSCSVCQAVQRDPVKVPPHPWSYAQSPWQRIHVDYVEKNGRHYLLVVGSFSKWLEVFPMTSCTSSKISNIYDCCLHSLVCLRFLWFPTMAVNSVHVNFTSSYGLMEFVIRVLLLITLQRMDRLNGWYRP